ncbi:hypothetical protein [Flavobacterium sp.]|uniref:hypothetical protein n=1 Tax=Flavobacterium sp. TaxID=239 RepID=UPI0038D0255E
MMNTPNTKYRLLFGLLFLVQSTQAQTDPFFNDNVTDVPAAPINYWIFPMFIVGVLLMFINLNKRKSSF